ncbi:pirin family protein [Thermoplasma sp. Kam2015]|uniref:pirin family protein n=1 Tax=Thermoplasma sp. Kam2015 TaxID=2094122 RepID=UPI000D9152C1|nr:pirin family protein [Thermoplasma sp. Kam2015]PYB69108.1 pirin family protein [Thermoplasma sp. Kam2015]
MISKIPEYFFEGSLTYDGAGVKLRRMFGSQRTAQITDPFLLMDIFGSERREDYDNGFPWHPHRGIETITYQMAGKTLHEDSEGHKGIIGPGEFQWMTAGSGIFHEEMPKPIYYGEEARYATRDNSNKGIQLWLNLPSSSKMTDPSYRSIKPDQIPHITDDYGNRIRIVAGNVNGVNGALNENFQYDMVKKIDPYYIEIIMEAGAKSDLSIPEGYRGILAIIDGNIRINTSQFSEKNVVVLSREGSNVSLKALADSRIILLAGRPLNEPIAWYGPIVMNTREEIINALKELQEGNFVKNKNPMMQ